MNFECAILRDNAFGLHDEIGERRGVSLQCFVGNQMLLAVLIHEAVEDRYHRRKITREDGNRLVDGDLQAIGPVIAKKYMLGEVLRYHRVGQRDYPLIALTMSDMGRIAPYAEPDTSLNVDGFKFG